MKTEREKFERYKAQKIGIDYDVLKADLDDCERRFPNRRYAGWNFQEDWELWQAAKADTSQWEDYTVKSPRIDGNYQIFIDGMQLVATWHTGFGFACVEDGEAYIQDLISHWAVLSNDPVETQEQGNV